MTLVPILLAATLAAAPAQPPRTLRVDYFHTGTQQPGRAHEAYSLDRVVLEPLPFPGHPDRALDASGLGKYMFEVRDLATHRLVYSRGFASIYGEWETTDEAKAQFRTFHESLRFPAPTAPVQVIVKRRAPDLSWHEAWTAVVDPKGMFVDPSAPEPAGALLEVQKSGAPQDKVDILILGDGYTQAERAAFERDARRLADTMFSFSPFKERRQDFNVWGLAPPTAESGVSRPSTGQHRRSRVGATYDAFGSERYVLTFDNRTLRDVASQAPYEFLVILVNNDTYGGGGIHNLYSTVAARSAWSPYLFIHEFGHHFAGLADEYYTSDVAYGSPPDRPEPWERNATADGANPKWKALVSPGVPLPTPWRKKEFEDHSHATQKKRRAIRAANRPEAEMDALFREQQKWETKQLGSEKHAGKVGAFEGALYEAQGYFRPQADCVMFTRDEVPFCRVCQLALDEVIDLYAGPRAAAR